MATVATQNPGLTGITPTVANASGGGDRVSPGTRLHVINGGGSSINLTLAVIAKVRDLTAGSGSRVIACPNGTVPTGLKIIDLPADLYADPADGLVGLAWSATTSVTFWVEGPLAS